MSSNQRRALCIEGRDATRLLDSVGRDKTRRISSKKEEKKSLKNKTSREDEVGEMGEEEGSQI